MRTIEELRAEIRTLVVSNLMLQVKAEEISFDQPLFGPGSLGLDSVDALQIVVALDKTYGLKIPDPQTAQAILKDLSTITQAVKAHIAKSPELS